MRKMLKLFLILIIIGILFYLGLVGFVCIAESRAVPQVNGDCLIVLGAQVRPDGTPSVQLLYRLQTALEAYQENPCPIIVCGAQGADEPMTEGERMYQWFLENGVPESDLYIENTSTNTQQNLANAKVIMDRMALSHPNIVTSDYHLPRALAYAKDIGLNAGGYKAPCKPEILLWIKNHFREALAWVKYFLVRYIGLAL